MFFCILKLYTMKTMVLLSAVVNSDTFEYIVGGVLFFLILVYLIYSLIKPEKF